MNISFRCALPLSRPIRRLRFCRERHRPALSTNEKSGDNLRRQFFQIEGQPLNWPATPPVLLIVSFNSFPNPSPTKSFQICQNSILKSKTDFIWKEWLDFFLTPAMVGAIWSSCYNFCGHGNKNVHMLPNSHWEVTMWSQSFANLAPTWSPRSPRVVNRKSQCSPQVVT